jgi:hypothetical protein
MDPEPSVRIECVKRAIEDLPANSREIILAKFNNPTLNDKELAALAEIGHAAFRKRHSRANETFRLLYQAHWHAHRKNPELNLRLQKAIEQKIENAADQQVLSEHLLQGKSLDLLAEDKGAEAADRIRRHHLALLEILWPFISPTCHLVSALDSLPERDALIMHAFLSHRPIDVLCKELQMTPENFQIALREAEVRLRILITKGYEKAESSRGRMELLNKTYENPMQEKIVRWHLVDGKALSAIAQSTGLGLEEVKLLLLLALGENPHQNHRSL